MKNKLPTGVVVAVIAVVAIGAAFFLFKAFSGGGSASSKGETEKLTQEMTKDNSKYEAAPPPSDVLDMKTGGR